VAVLIPLGAALIRVGNLMNSEIYGHVTTLPWGFYFDNSSDVTSGLEMLEPRHPTQIYEALMYLSTYVVLIVYYFSTKVKTRINGEFIIGYLFVSIFTFRFFIEFLKNDQVGFEQAMPINMGQLLSIPFVLIGAYLLYMAYTGKKLAFKQS
jgi:prolipoprotein diacylglyceryl transferase